MHHGGTRVTYTNNSSRIRGRLFQPTPQPDSDVLAEEDGDREEREARRAEDQGDRMRDEREYE